MYKDKENKQPDKEKRRTTAITPKVKKALQEVVNNSTVEGGTTKNTSIVLCNALNVSGLINGTPFTITNRGVAIKIDTRNWYLNDSYLTWLLEAAIAKNRLQIALPLDDNIAKKLSAQFRHTTGKFYYSGIRKGA